MSSQKNAFVTGAGSGIGRAIALRLAAAGHGVAVADLDPDGAEQTVSAIVDAGGKAIAVTADVADGDQVRAARERCESELGPVRIVVNNAGWDEIKFFHETDRAFWEKVVRINYLGVLTVTQEFYDSLREGGSQSRIVNVASDAGRVGSMGEAVYAGAKGGVIAFTKSIARELARDRVPANCVCPGPTATALLAAQPDSMTEKLRNAIPFKRFAEADEIAGAVAFFASEDAEYITGQVLSVSGGLTFHG